MTTWNSPSPCLYSSALFIASIRFLQMNQKVETWQKMTLFFGFFHHHVRREKDPSIAIHPCYSHPVDHPSHHLIRLLSWPFDFISEMYTLPLGIMQKYRERGGLNHFQDYFTSLPTFPMKKKIRLYFRSPRITLDALFKLFMLDPSLSPDRTFETLHQISQCHSWSWWMRWCRWWWWCLLVLGWR